MRDDVQFSCQNWYLFQSYLKHFRGPNFQSCLQPHAEKKKKKSIFHIIELSHVGMVSDQLVFVLPSVFRREITKFLFGLQPNLQGLRLSDFLILSFCQFLGRKYPFPYLGSKIFSSRTLLLANLQGLRLSDFLYHQSSILSKEIEVTYL